LKVHPGVRIVLIRTRGLWGSSFSQALGHTPNVLHNLFKGGLALLASGIFFAPRRNVSIELIEPAEFPRTADRNSINRYLEQFYNQDAPGNTYVPYTLWEKGGTRVVSEPPRERLTGDLAGVPATTREIVLNYLRTESGRLDLRDDLMLSRDLGLDSLALVSLSVWLESEFGFPVGDSAANLLTIGDVMLAACGTVASGGLQALHPVSSAWFRATAEPISIPEGQTLTEVFLKQARAFPKRVAVADQGSGVKTYRDIVTSILVLKPVIERLPGDYIGIMLPASAAAPVIYLAAVFAGKIPVMVNWTVGTRNSLASLELLGVKSVLTAGQLVQRLESQGTDFGSLKSRFILLEEMGRKISMSTKLLVWLKSRLSWRLLRNAKVRDTAVILFTSGSESLPKAVPLSHANFLANIRDIAKILHFTRQDKMIGILPPFHSFGILGTMLFPLCGAIPVVYHPNPTEGGMLARLIEAYRATLLVGTPTFLAGIVRAASDSQLQTLRLVISGAEKCPVSLYQTIGQRWPQMKVLEGYGITECSPVVSANREESIRPGTIGRILPSVEYAIQDVETGRRAERGRSGLLLVRGPSIFSGYLNYNGPSPFVAFEEKPWYRTGDLVSEDEEGVITFAGRLKRFVKLGGEMISLPAIEEVLARCYRTDSDDKPVLAVEATPQELNPELVLFTVRDLQREEVNRRLREGGFSPIYNIRRIVKLPEIPVLGTGKTDYRALKERL
jgi:long-chain-fatty-acid--[acyl-carrier-protein] ligase